MNAAVDWQTLCMVIFGISGTILGMLIRLVWLRHSEVEHGLITLQKEFMEYREYVAKNFAGSEDVKAIFRKIDDIKDLINAMGSDIRDRLDKKADK